MTELADLRKNYSRGSLSEADTDPNPMKQFQTWFAQALSAGLPEPNAMTLATVGADGRPAARILLIKGVDDRGFTFFSNYDSRKGQELAVHPQACLLFYWIELERQVRIEGCVERIDARESDAYFDSRPLASRIGAWASEQSSVIASRTVIEERVARYTREFGATPPRPPHWGGYRLRPDYLEFWQGRPSRLHDRICYRRAPEGWTRARLAP